MPKELSCVCIKLRELEPGLIGLVVCFCVIASQLFLLGTRPLVLCVLGVLEPCNAIPYPGCLQAMPNLISQQPLAMQHRAARWGTSTVWESTIGVILSASRRVSSVR